MRPARLRLFLFVTAVIGGFIVGLPASAQSPYPFKAGVLIPSQNITPYQAFKADFNGDGNLDAITASSCASPGNCLSGSVSVYLGNGDGTFRPPVVTSIPYSTSSGGSLRSIAVGDFNGDGKPDVAVISDDLPAQYSATLRVLLGNGDGSFTQSASYTFNGTVNTAAEITLAVGDFDGDGKLDLVATTPCYNEAVNGCSVGAVVVYPGNGDGTLGSPLVYTTFGNSALPVLVTDINHDGHDDIVAGSYYSSNSGQSSLTILLNSGSGSFTQSLFTQSVVTLPYYGVDAIVAADFNGDGKMDLATASSNVEVLFGNGDGTFQSPVAYSTSTSQTGLTVADLNGDGHPDLVAGSTASGDVNGAAILLNDGQGNFQVSTYPAGGSAQGSVIAGDFNNDGHVDVIVDSACYISNCGGYGTLGLLLGNGDGTLQAATFLPVAPGTGYLSGSTGNAVLATDLNGDGIADLIVVNESTNGQATGEVTVYLGQGGGKFGPPTTFTTGAVDPLSAVLGDFNHDGKTDIALSELCYDSTCQAGGVSILLGNGDGTFQAPVVYATGGLDSERIAAGDVNGDGNLDLIVADQQGCSGCSYGGVSVFFGNGDGTFQPAVASTIPNQYNYAVGAADLNHDGKAEFVLLGEDLVNSGTSYTAAIEEIFSVNSDGTLTQIGPSYSAGGYFASLDSLSLAVADVNNDGNQDIVVTASCAHYACNDAPSGSGADYTLNEGGIGVLLGNGDGTFSNGSAYAIPDANFLSASLTDVNGDGKLDLIAATPTGVAVLNGNGDGTFGPATVYAGALNAGPLQLAVADLNGDGAPDIALGTGDSGNAGTAIFFNSAPPVPEVSLSATSINFGTRQAGGCCYPIPQVQLTNSGTAPLTISSIQTTGADPGDFYETDNCPVTPNTLPSSDHCTIIVDFGGPVLGQVTAAIAISDNAAGAPQSIALSGTLYDFSISAAPASNSIKGGKAQSYTVSVTPLGGNTFPVTLSVAGCPANASCTFSPAQFTLNGSTASTSTLTVKGNGKTPSGNYTLVITGTVSGASHSTSVQLTVQ